MKIENIILIQRDGGNEYRLCEISDKGICRLEGITVFAVIGLSLWRILNALNTPNGAWSMKIDADKFIYENEVWVKGKLLSECENNCDIIEIDEVGHPRQLAIRRFNQIKKRSLV